MNLLLLFTLGFPSGLEWLWITAGGVALGFVGTAIFHVLWNWTIPGIFHLPEITFWQAFRLLLLFGILLGAGTFRNNPTPPPVIYIGQPPYELKK
jgi:hypothetical protein